MGSMLEFGASNAGERAFRLYISGDTLVHEDLEDIPRRYAGIDLALLHLGGTRVLGILVTMDAAQGVEALRIIDPRRAIPITTTITTSSNRRWPSSSRPSATRGLRAGSSTSHAATRTGSTSARARHARRPRGPSSLRVY